MSTKRNFLLGLATLLAIPFTAARSSNVAAAPPGADLQDGALKLLAARVQRLEDMQAIQKVQAKYLHYLFTHDFSKIFPECFAQKRDDVTLEFSDSGIYRGPEHIKEVYETFNAVKAIPGFFIMHMATNPYIEIAADGVSAKSHWLSPGITGNENGAGWVFGPYYIDYVKEDGDWRILHTNLAALVRTRFETSWAKAEDNGTVRTLPIEPDGPSTLYRPYAQVKHETDIFKDHPDLPEPY